jgi:hypothetical protein
MRRSGSRATTSEQVPITPDHAELLMLEFGADGRLLTFQVVRGNLRHETEAATQARLLCEGVAARLRQAGSVQELLARARQALDLVENLAALEELHGAEARALLAQSPAPQGLS